MDRDRLRSLDLAHVWHPYTQMQDLADDDFPIIERAEGRRLSDVDGRAYWDGVASIWLNVHGHRVPHIDAAIQAQLGKVAHSTLLGQGNVPSIELAARLARLAPEGLERVFYSDNGSTAVEGALKIALQAWHLRGRPQKNRILSFEGGYHGDTLGCVAAAYVPAFHAAFRGALPQPTEPLPWPDTYRGVTDADGRPLTDPEAVCAATLEAVDARLRIEGPRTAAVIVEPMVQGVGGIRVMPSGFLRGLRDLCTEHEVLLVADEVATGFGRTGRAFACDHEQVTPDLMAVGKGITGGYLPLAATLATEGLYETFLGPHEEGRQLFHGHSYTGNQLGCAAALASLDLLEPMLPGLPARGRRIAERLAASAEEPFVGDVRGLGFMHGLELVADKATKRPFPAAARAAWRVFRHARARGLLVRPYANIALFVPPLASTEEELDEMLGLYAQALRDARGDLEAAVPALTA